jgi:hypothetical protein
MKPGRPTAQYSPTPILALYHQAVYTGPRLCLPYHALPRKHVDAAVAQSAARHLTPALPTSFSPPLHAPRMQPPPPHACHAFILYVATTPRRSSFLFPLHSPLLFCCRASSPSPPFPEHPVIVRTEEPEPPPSPPRVALRSSSCRQSPVLELAHHRLRFLRFTGHR